MVYFKTKSFFITFSAVAIILGLILLVSLYRKYRHEERLRKSGIRQNDQMDGYEFEHYLSALFKGLGYSAKVTKGSGDFGADLILNKDGIKIAVQAKRYKQAGWN